MSLAEIAGIITQLQNDVTKIQGKLSRLATSAKRSLNQTAANLQKVVHHLEEIEFKKKQDEVAINYTTLEGHRKKDSPRPLELGKICIRYIKEGYSDREIAERTKYETRYIQQVRVIASSPQICSFIENGHISAETAYRAMQRYELSDVILTIQEGIAESALRKNPRVTPKVIERIVSKHHFQPKRKN